MSVEHTEALDYLEAIEVRSIENDDRVALVIPVAVAQSLVAALGYACGAASNAGDHDLGIRWAAIAGKLYVERHVRQGRAITL